MKSPQGEITNPHTPVRGSFCFSAELQEKSNGGWWGVYPCDFCGGEEVFSAEFQEKRNHPLREITKQFAVC